MTAAQLIVRCREKGRDLICAGQMLAVRDIMEALCWSVSELAKRSGVSASMLFEMLRLDKFPTSDKLGRLARAFGMKLYVLDAFAELELEAEITL